MKGIYLCFCGRKSAESLRSRCLRKEVSAACGELKNGRGEVIRLRFKWVRRGPTTGNLKCTYT